MMIETDTSGKPVLPFSDASGMRSAINDIMLEYAEVEIGIEDIENLSDRVNARRALRETRLRSIDYIVSLYTDL